MSEARQEIRTPEDAGLARALDVVADRRQYWRSRREHLNPGVPAGQIENELALVQERLQALRRRGPA